MYILKISKLQGDVLYDALTFYGKILFGLFDDAIDILKNDNRINLEKIKVMLFELKCFCDFSKSNEAARKAWDYRGYWGYPLREDNNPVFKREEGDILVEALDFYSRIGIGQLNEIGSILSLYDAIKIDYSKSEEIFAKMKLEIFNLQSNEFFGIFHKKVPDFYKVAWDLKQVIRHRLAWDSNPKGGIGVSFDVPFKSSENEELATIESTALDSDI